MPGDTVMGKITVINQGDVSADSIQIYAYLPEGISLNDVNWTLLNDSTAVRTLTVADGIIQTGGLLPDSMIMVTIDYTIDLTFMGDSLVTYVEIGGATDGAGNPVTDIDSSPDSDRTNDSGGVPNSPTDNEVNQSPPIDEDDHDPMQLEIEQVFNLSLTKTTDSTIVQLGDLVTYQIRVRNEGSLDAYNISITDHIPMGMSLADSEWTESGDTARYNTPIGYLAAGQDSVIEITLQVDLGFRGNSLENKAEIAGADNDTDSMNTPPVDINSVPEEDQTPPNEDDEDIATIGVEQVFDLALLQTLAPGQPNPIRAGDTLELKLVVTNQGTIAADTVELSEYLPEGVTLSGLDANGFTVLNDSTLQLLLTTGNGKLPAGGLLPDSMVMIVVELVVDQNSTADSLVFYGEISEDGQHNDYDSTPDAIDGNDSGGIPNSVTDNEIEEAPPIDEDDHDPAVISLQYYDLALIKALAEGQTDTVKLGNDIDYKITIINEGIFPAYDVEVADHIPNGMILSGLDTSGWVMSGDLAFNTLSAPIFSGDSACIYIKLKLISGNPNTTIKNVAEVSGVKDAIGNVIQDIDSEVGTTTTAEEEAFFEDDEDLQAVMLGDFDPIGYIYCDKTGAIITGGKIVVTSTPPGGAIFYSVDGLTGDTLDGRTGKYQFFTNGVEGTYTMDYIHPDGFPLSVNILPETGALDPTGKDGDPAYDVDGIINNYVTLGSNVNNNYLIDKDASSNPYYLSFDLETDDPYIDLNNIPVSCVYIGAVICQDTGGDGNFNIGLDNGFAGITVNLYECSDTLLPINTTISEPDGSYRFDGLETGCYKVQFVIPDGNYIPTDNGIIGQNGWSIPLNLDYGDCDTTTTTCISACPVSSVIPTSTDICQGDSVQLTASIVAPSATYKWTPSIGLNDPFIANPIAFPRTTTFYVVEVDPGFGACVSYDTVVVNVHDIPNPDFYAEEVCMGEEMAFIDKTISFGPIVRWDWDFGDGAGTSTDQNPYYSYNSAGHYMVKLTIENANGCRDSIWKEVTVNPMVWAIASAENDTICAGECTRLLAQGGTHFTWLPTTNMSDSSSFSPEVCPTVSTTYTVTVTNDFGCIATDQVTVTVLPGPTVDVAMTDVTECGRFDGSITITANGPASNYQYSIDGGLTFYNTNTFNGLPASSYIVVVRGGGCEVLYANNPVVIGEGLSPSITNVDVLHPSCEATDGSIVINATGGTGLQYSINGGIDWSSSNSFSDLGGGTYFIAVSSSDRSCITYYPAVTLIQPTRPTIIDVTYTNPTDCDENNGTIFILADSDNAIEYGLDNGMMTVWQSSNNFFNLPAGTYDIYVRNAGNTCITPYALNSIQLTAPTAPAITAVTVDQPTDCGSNNASLQITATAGSEALEYSIDGGINWDNFASYTNLQPGVYNVFIRNTGGTCVVAYTGNPIIISYPDAPEIVEALHNHPTDCGLSDGTIEITANAGSLSMIYSIDGGLTWQLSSIFNGLSGGIYNIRVANSDTSCMAIYPTLELIDQVGGTIDEVIAESNCENGEGMITISASSTTALEYSIDGGATYQSSNVFTSLADGTYNIFVRNASNNCTIEYAGNPITISRPVATIDNVVAINPDDCGGENGVITITGIGADLEYSIDGGINYQSSREFANLPTGTYNIFVRNTLTGCETAYLNNPVLLEAPDAPQITEVLHTNPTECGQSDGTIQITASSGSGAIIYSIDGGTTWQPGNFFNNLSGGIYNIRIANSDTSCIVTYPTIELFDQTGGMIDDVIVESDCENGEGVIMIVASSTTPLEYSIDGGLTYQSSNIFSHLDDGTYPIFIRNVSDNCEVAYTGNPVTITRPTDGIDNVVAIDPTDCGGSDGAISVEATGGDLSYSIDGGINFYSTNIFNDLPAGTYNIFVKNNSNNCITSYFANPVELVEPQAPVITSVESSDPTDCEANDGIITVVADGIGGLQYSLDGATWSNGNTFIDLLPGLYNVYVRYNDETCTVPYINNPVVITAPTGPSIIDCIGTNPTDCNTNDGTLTVIASGGTEPLQYSVDGGTTWQTSNEFTGLSSGIYSVAVANADQTCKAIHPMCVLSAPEPPVVNEVTIADPTNCGLDDGSIAIFADGNGGLEYSIDNGTSWSANSFFANLAAGFYHVKVRNAADNCEVDYGPVEVTAPTPPTILAGVDNLSTCTGSSIPINIIMSESIAHYTILGSGGYLNDNAIGGTLTFDAFLNGVVNNFTVTLENTDGCTVVEEFAIFQTSDPEADFIVHNPICAETDVMIEFTGEASPGAILNWDLDGGIVISSSSATADAPAGATLVVQWGSPGGKTISLDIDDGGCTDRKVQNINVNKLPFANAGEDIAICEGECVQLNGIGNGAMYMWSPATGLSATDIPNPMACPTVTTTYQLIVMGAEGCMAMDEITVMVSDHTMADAGEDVSLCTGETTQLNATGGVSYAWSPTTGLSNPNIANPVASPTTITTYSVTVTNATGCTAVDEVIVDVHPLPIVSAGADKMICVGENTMLSATGGVSYVWTPATGLSSTLVPNPIATPTTTTTYTVVATDANGCTGSDQVTVIVGGNANANAGADQTICIGSSVQLNASGGVIYSWSPTTGLSNPNIANPIANPIVTTTYTVTVTNTEGCIGTDQITVNVNENIIVHAGADQTICAGASAFLNAAGGVIYSWSPATGLSNPNIANPIATPAFTTTYTVTATNAEGCTGTDQVTINVNNDGIPISAGADQTICVGGFAQLSASGGVTYSWSPATGLNNPNIANPIATPTTTTTYTVVAMNAQGCTGSDQVTVFVMPGEDIVACPDKFICGGGSVRLTVNGGVSWVWSPATGLDNPNIAAPIASPTVTTLYTVTGTDANGCTDTDEVLVIVNGNIAANAGPDVTICQGSSTNLNASGGTTYSWSPATGLSNPNIANPTASPLFTTTYTVTVTNAEGCIGTDQVTVHVNNIVLINAGSNVTICRGSATILNASGGTNYFWMPTTGLSNPNIANPIANPTTTTTYCVTVQNANGCMGTDCVTVTVRDGAEVVACEDKTICAGGSTPLTVTTGIAYSWSPAASLDNPTVGTPIASPLVTTTYTVTVTDANGCIGVDQVVVNVNSGEVANAGNDVSICAGSSTQLNGSGGTTYNWSPTTGLSNPFIANPIASPTTTTTYTLTVSNNSGCTDTDQVIVGVTSMANANAGNDVSICAGESTQLNATGGMTYSWSPTTGLSNPFIANPVASPITTTIYTVTATTSGGCVATDQVIVGVHSAPTISPVISNPSCCNNDGSITLTVLGGSGNFSYNWTPNVSNSNSAQGLAAGEYKVVVTDNMGCDVVGTINLAQNCNTCEDIVPERLVCVEEDETVSQLCLPIRQEDIGNYEITAAGTILHPTHGCDFENLNAYSYSLLPGGGNAGPYKIDSWTVNGIVYNGMVNNMNELTTWMNTIDPTGNWTHNSPVLIIMGGHPTTVYGDMKITHQATWIETTLNPNITGVAQGTLVEVPLGNADSVVVMIENKEDCCKDMIVIKRCGTTPETCTEEIITAQLIEAEVNNCSSVGTICIEIPLQEILNYSFAVNGNEYAGGFRGCDFDTMFAYTYFTMPDMGANGPYMLRSWQVGNQTYSGQFNTITDLVNLMNTWDPIGDWKQEVATVTIQGGHPSVNYGAMDVEQINTGAFAILELNTNLLPMGTELSLSVGTHEVLVTNNSTECEDRFTAIINCVTSPKDDCTDFITDETRAYTISDCSEKAGFCVEIPFADLGNYTIDQNGEFYTGEIDVCTTDGNSIMLYAGEGKHIFLLTNELTECSDAITVKISCTEAIVNGNKMPKADRDLSRTQMNRPVVIDVASNDRAIESSTLRIIETPKYGELIINPDNTITYEPNEGFCNSRQPDFFRYEICNDFGCDEAGVQVVVDCKPIRVFSGFSPNGDEINDYLRIDGLEAYPNSVLKIYNRWGSELFSQKGYANNWDGTYEGEPLPQGTYFYLLDDGKGHKYSGFIQINR